MIQRRRVFSAGVQFELDGVGKGECSAFDITGLSDSLPRLLLFRVAAIARASFTHPSHALETTTQIAHPKHFLLCRSFPGICTE